MMKHFELIIVIPAHNEEERFSADRHHEFLKIHPQVLLCFVNDGSTDKTINLFRQLKASYKENVEILSLRKNSGKAHAVHFGFSHCNLNFRYNKIAYLDADLSTSLEECYEISKHLDQQISFAFASRIAKLDSNIQRKLYRFIIGRCMATLISFQLNLRVYDTQCGCKIFNKELASQVFQEQFMSKWLFDVEIFHRILSLYGKKKLLKISKEVPLQSWIDGNKSKVSPLYFFRVWIDLINIYFRYKNKKMLNEIVD